MKRRRRLNKRWRAPALVLLSNRPNEPYRTREVVAEVFPKAPPLAQVRRPDDLLEHVRSERTDCVLLDATHLHRDWARVIERLQIEAPDVAIVVVTDKPDKAVEMAALYAGAQDYMVRADIDAGGLARVVPHAIGRREATRQSESFEEGYRALFERMPVAMYRTASDGTLLDANPALVKLLGYLDKPSLLDVSAVDLYVDPDARSANQSILEFDGVVIGFEMELRRQDGRSVWVSDSSRLVRDSESKVLFSEGVLIDVTERRRARHKLESSEARYRQLIDRSPMAIWEEDFTAVGDWIADLKARGFTDVRGYLDKHPEELRDVISGIRVTAVNDAAVALVEADDRSQLTSLADLLNGDVRASFTEQIATIAEGRDRLILEQSGSTLKGQRLDTVMHWVAPVTDGDIDLKHIVVSLADITEHRVAQEREAELARSKDEFIASVSHELRTPLTSVVGFARELEGGWEHFSVPERQEFLRHVSRSSQDVAAIVEDLLVAARSEMGVLSLAIEPVDVAEQIALVLDEGAEALSEITSSGTRALALADPARLRQILRNLVSNARKHGGERVVIDTTEGPGEISIFVRDNGTGIPEGEWEQAFEPYYQRGSPSQPASMGLGLAVSRQLADVMGGTLSYRYTGSESVFELTLRSP